MMRFLRMAMLCVIVLIGCVDKANAGNANDHAAQFAPVLGTECRTEIALTWGMNMPSTWDQMTVTVSGSDIFTDFTRELMVSTTSRQDRWCLNNVVWLGSTPLDLVIVLGTLADRDNYTYVRYTLPAVDIAHHVQSWHFTQLPMFGATQVPDELVTSSIGVDFTVSVRTSPGTVEDLKRQKGGGSITPKPAP